MKTASKLVLIGLIISLPLMAFAQPDPPEVKGKMMRGLDLTDEQQAQIETLRLDHQKQMMTLKGQLSSLQTEMKILLTEDSPSVNKIKDLAAKIGESTEKMAMEKANHRIEVRKLLTDEQKAKFDMMTLHRGERMGCRGPRTPDAPPIPGCRGHGDKRYGERFHHRNAR